METLSEKRIARVTVVISTLGRPEALKRCLEALLSGQALPAEIVVVDQSQDDRTRSVVEWVRPCAVPVLYIHHDGRGLAVSQNIGFAHAAHPVIAVTDDDCIPNPDWIAEIERGFAREDQIDVLTGRVLPLGPEQPGLYPVASRTGTQKRSYDRQAMPWDIGSGNNFAAKREWLVRVGGNDERLGPGSPGQGATDIDLFYRLLQAGARICYEPRSLVYHERTNKAGRIARRWPYGYGIGACFGARFLTGERHALRILLNWFSMRMKRLAGALRRKQLHLVHEEFLVLSGTLGGTFHALRFRILNDSSRNKAIS